MAHQSTTQLPFLTAHTFIHMHETEVRNWACLHAPAAITTLTQYGIAMFSAAVPAFWRQMSGGSLSSRRPYGGGFLEATCPPGGSLEGGSLEAAFWRQSVLAEHDEYGKLLYVQDPGELQAEILAADGTVSVMTLSFDLHASWLWLRYEQSAVCPMHICWCG